MQQEIMWRVIGTVLVIAVAIISRIIFLRYVQKHNFPNADAKRRVLVTTRNMFFLTVILIVSIIWLSHIRDIAISLAAIAVALVIATKEILLCFLAGIIRGITQPFRVADRIEINGLRGDVIDVNLIGTTLLEISSTHQYTGRTVTLPNSLFMSYPVINETYLDEFMLHIFSIPLKREDDLEKTEKIILDAANEVCTEYLGSAVKYMTEVSPRAALEVPSVEPRVSIEFPDSETVNLLVRVPVPSRRKGRIEQAIIRLYLTKLKEQA
jgi:small-conductance mechanosensitive channel